MLTNTRRLAEQTSPECCAMIQRWIDIMLIDVCAQDLPSYSYCSISTSKLPIIAWKRFFALIKIVSVTVWPRSSGSPEGLSTLTVPQSFMSAVAASVALTAVQITDADLLRIEEKYRRWADVFETLQLQFSPIYKLLVYFNWQRKNTFFSLMQEVAAAFHRTQCAPVLGTVQRESFALKVARLLWQYCATQMQGFSIFVTAWQTNCNPQSLSLLIPSDKGAHKAREGMFWLVYFRARIYHCEPRRVSWPLLGWRH